MKVRAVSRWTITRWFVLVALATAGPSALPATACTSFCFDTPDGPIFGSNLDLRWREGLVFVNAIRAGIHIQRNCRYRAHVLAHGLAASSTGSRVIEEPFFIPNNSNPG